MPKIPEPLTYLSSARRNHGSAYISLNISIHKLWVSIERGAGFKEPIFMRLVANERGIK